MKTFFLCCANLKHVSNSSCLLSDVHEAFDHVLDEIEAVYHTKVDYPVAEFIICFGFFVVLILEQIVLDCKEGWQKVRQIYANVSTLVKSY